jgi:putative aldouronate transport system permease protein
MSSIDANSRELNRRRERSTSTDSVVHRRMSVGARVRRDWVMLLLMVPGVAYLAIFFYVPLAGNVIAFQDYLPFVGIRSSEFVGFQNFVTLAQDPDFWNAVRNTLIIAFLQLVLYFPVPLVLALVLNSILSGRIRKFVQSVVYLPHFISWVLVVALFQEVLGGAGLLNGFLRHHGMDTLNIMSNPEWFKLLVTAQVIWKDTGWGTIIFLAALVAVDTSLYEASAVDGAGKWRRLWHVTLPAVRGVTILLLVLRLGDILSVGFEQLLLQRDAVGAEASDVLDTFVYYNGVLGGDWSTSAAAGLAKGVIGMILIFGANKVAHLFGEAGVYQK